MTIDQPPAEPAEPAAPAELRHPGLPALVRRHTAFEIRLLMRNGEQLLLTLVIPLVLLVALSATDVLALESGQAPRVAVVLPGVLALAVMSTAFTALAIATGFDRRAGVLKFLGSTPLQRSGVIVSKMLATLAVIALQSLLLVGSALLLGWRPGGSAAWMILLIGLGGAAFSAWALVLAGTVRAEATLALANGIYLLLLLGGGVIIPTGQLPAGLSTVAALLPSGALGDGLRAVMIDPVTAPWQSLAVLSGWAVAGVLVAVRAFRWE